MSNLKPFIILYTNEVFNVPEGYLVHAEDSDHAEDQFINAEPESSVTWIVQTDDINEAFDVYHRESTFEEISYDAD